MILAIDIGNTNITLGVWKGDEMLFESRMETNRSRLRDQYALELKGIFDLYSIQPKDIEGSIISSVVPQLISTFSSAIKLLTGKAPMVVGPGIKTGLNIKIDNPAQLGADLAVGAIAAIAEFPAPSIIFDMGTATTVSVVGKDGSYLGGMIMPGIAISLDALISRTAQLPQVSIQAPPRVIGKNTVNCIQSGANRQDRRRTRRKGNRHHNRRPCQCGDSVLQTRGSSQRQPPSRRPEDTLRKE